MDLRPPFAHSLGNNIRAFVRFSLGVQARQRTCASDGSCRSPSTRPFTAPRELGAGGLAAAPTLSCSGDSTAASRVPGPWHALPTAPAHTSVLCTGEGSAGNGQSPSSLPA